MNKTVKWILFLLLGVVVLWLGRQLFFNNSKDELLVTAEAVKLRTVVETVSASGQLFPEAEIKIASPISGEVVVLNVQDGDTVIRGQVLARIQGERGAAAAPRVTVPNVPPGFESLVQSMQAPRTVSGPSAATLTAPMSGVVTGLNVRKGERIGSMQMPGSELMRIADMSNIEVRVEVNENNIIKVSVGDSADVQVEAYNKRKFKGTVTRISNSAGRRSDVASMMSAAVSSFEVRIRLIPSSYADLFDSTARRRTPFRAGMNARAEIKTGKKERVPAVPVSAVTARVKGSNQTIEEKKEQAEKEKEQSGEESYLDEDELEEVVYVVRADGTVEKRTVLTGLQDMNFFEIKSGLKEGEKVVTGPYTAITKTLQHGKAVTVVPRDKTTQKE